MMFRLPFLVCVVLLGIGGATRVPAAEALATLAIDLAKVELAPLGGVTAEISRLAADQGGPGLRVAYDKPGEERRFVCVEARPAAPLAPFRAVDLSYRLVPAAGGAVRFAVLVYEQGGGVWFRAGSPMAPSAERRDCRFSLQGLRQAAFSQDASGQLEWDRVERVWIGFMVDGQGRGSYELSKAVLTGEAYRATEAVSLFRADSAQWSVGADPAVSGQAMELVEVEGAKCLRLRFRFPGGRHMYYVPTQPLEEMEYSAYGGLRFTYRATVPAGVDGLLVCVMENGGQFVATPPPAASGDWESVTVPWRAFPLGAWSKDDNGRLDVDAISRVSAGAHGTAQGEGGEGEILIRGIEVVPVLP
jgi:hypothetical protein